MTTSLLIEIGSASETFVMGWEVWTSIFSGMIALLVFSYKFGYFKGKQETCHDQYKLGMDKGKDISSDISFKKGFRDGQRDFRNSTHILHDVSCRYYPSEELIKRISIIKKRDDGTVVDVECPYIENDKTCYLINKKCCKF